MRAEFPKFVPLVRSSPWIWMGLLVLMLAAGSLPAGAAGAADPPSAHPAGAFNFCYQGKLPDTRVLVIDLSRQRLLVLNYLGEMTLEYEYPCATGVNQGGKISEGDERTPVGLYFTTHRYKDRKITIFGDRAIHLNYPNPVDRAAGRQGNGIFIHGTNQPFKPRSTNGCIVVRNEDLAVVAKLIKDQLTPVVVVDKFELPDATQRSVACDYLLKLENFPAQPQKEPKDPNLALRGTNNHKKRLNSLAPRLPGLLAGQGAKVKVTNRGLMLLGVGDQWVLVADQDITGPRRRQVRVTRRFYLNGPKAPAAKLVRGEWILPDLASADRLSAWAPRKIAPSPPPPPPKAQLSPTDEINRMLKGWMRAWQRKDLKRYITYYAPQFESNGKNRTAWKKQKAYLNRVYRKIRVKAKDVKIKVNGNRAKVSFIQIYRSDWHKDVGDKKLTLVKIKGKWRITSESWKRRSRTASISGKMASR